MLDENVFEKLNKLQEYCKKNTELNRLMGQIYENRLIIQDLTENIKYYESLLENGEPDTDMDKIINRIIKKYNLQIGEEFGKMDKLSREMEKLMKKLNLEL